MKSARNEQEMKVVFGDVTLGIHSSDFSCIFSYQAGGLESLVFHGREWLYRPPRPVFWRALTDNDRGCGFHLRSGMWLSAQMFLCCTDIQVQVDGCPIPLPQAPGNNQYTGQERAKKVRITYLYETITVPSTNVSVSYEVTAEGKIHVSVHYFGKKELPELPVFGLRFVMPEKVDYYEYEGLSGETYPDRKQGGIPGVYRVEGLPVTPYLVPQDCGMHMDTKWVRICRSKSAPSRCFLPSRPSGETGFSGLIFCAKDAPFAFSCLPYTAEELENATHQEELPPARRTVLSIFGAVRGVGGINSWGEDVEESYHIDAGKDISYGFSIQAE